MHLRVYHASHRDEGSGLRFFEIGPRPWDGSPGPSVPLTLGTARLKCLANLAQRFLHVEMKITGTDGPGDPSHELVESLPRLRQHFRIAFTFPELTIQLQVKLRRHTFFHAGVLEVRQAA